MGRQILHSALLLAALLSNGAYAAFNRYSFPKDFVFGTGSAAYQYEGAVKEGGRGPSVWDTFSHIPGKVLNGDTGDVANDFYHHYKEDVNLLKDMNMDAFRFSISWSRILPNGTLSGGVNKEGVAFYNNLINAIIAKGMKPFVTIFHWDTPLALESKYGGFLNDNIVKDYLDYADLCFKEFGDRVQYWATFNEPWTYCSQGYGTGVHAPGRCSPHVSKSCGAGDSSREPYLAAHHIILAHAKAVRLYRYRYQGALQAGAGRHHVRVALVRAQQRHGGRQGRRAAQLGLHVRLVPGPDQSAMVKGSYDFIGVNYYTAYYTISLPPPNGLALSYDAGLRANTTGFRNGKPIGPQIGIHADFLHYPAGGFRELLLYTKRRYNNPVIYVTENGIDEANNKTLPIKEALKDGHRISFTSKHLQFVNHAIKDGVKVKGYFTWTFMDCFEWGDGYLDRFGLIYVDRSTLRRYRKASSYWIANFLKRQ